MISPCLFNMCIDHILREAMERFSRGVKVDERNVQLLLFADDLMLVAKEEEYVVSILRILDDVMAKRNMKMK